jgi:hypothetical protein
LNQTIIRPADGHRMIRAAFLASGLLLAGLALPGAADAATYYVRADGGTPTQCNGKADTAYPGSGSNLACAWKHPFMALPPGKTPRIVGGDTLIVGPGNYMMGIGAPGAEGCSSSYAYDCHMPRIPSGPSATAPTRILGKGYNASCSAAPQLWGTERAYTIFDLRGSSNVEIACFEVTDRSPCIQGHGAGAACGNSGPWAGRGLIAQDSANVKLTDLNIHGMANKGIHAGRLRDWTMTRLTLRANGWVGWDGDIGAGNSSNSGNIIFRESEISWNGCAEKYPSTEIHACWGQQKGGYGDGLGTHATGGHWLFEDTLVHHNTSDGIDLLYMADGGSVTFRRVWAEGNAGNQLKTQGTARIENSVVIGNCGYFDGRFPGMVSGDHCRAMGNALSIGMFASSSVDLVNNTIASEGDCLVVSGGGTSSARLNIWNNTMIGHRDRTGAGENSCLHFAAGGSPTINWRKNHVSGVKNNACPSGSLCGTSPKLVNASLTGFDPAPQSGSPLINAADAAVAPAADYNNRARSTPDIGAIEFGATGTAPAPSPTPPSTGTVTAKVSSMVTTSWWEGSRHVYRANVTVVDGNGKPLPNVAVSGNWTKAGVATGSAVSDAAGQAKVAGGWLSYRNTATFCVTGISGTNVRWDGVQRCASN